MSVEPALLSFGEQAVVTEALEDCLDVVDMFALTVAKDQNVVEVGYCECVETVGEYTIDEVLKRGWSIVETEGHNKVLVVAVASPECGFPLLTSGNTDKIVSSAEINL